MEKKLDKIEAKIDQIQEKISAINVTLVAQHISLETHIKRTNILEQKLEPIEKDRYAIKRILQIIGAAAVVVSIIEGVLKIVHG